MLGPFRAGDAKATYMQDVKRGRFLIGLEGLFLKVAIPGQMGGMEVNRWTPLLLKLDASPYPKLGGTGAADLACTVLTEEARLEISFSDPRGERESCLGCVGVDRGGAFAVAGQYGQDSYLVELATGEARSSGEERFIWWKAWRMELVLDGDRRLLLAERTLVQTPT